MLATTFAVLLATLHVMWDDGELDLSRTTAEKRVHQGRYAGEVMRFDRPWEGDGCGFFNVVATADEKGPLYRMYYLAWSITDIVRQTKGAAILPAVIESRDGIAWTRPELGLCEFQGSKANNLLLPGGWDNFCVFKDDNPACPPSERYKATAQRVLGGGDHSLECYVSADGLHFRHGWRLLTGHGQDMKFDSVNVACWDAARGVYRVYCRGLHEIRPDTVYGVWKVREIRTAESKDFKSWSEVRPIAFTGEDVEDVPLYTNGVYPYFRDPGILTGFPTRYIERPSWTPNYDALPSPDLRRERMNRGEKRYGLAITDCIFMFSRDGYRFERSGEAVYTPGPERNPRAWVYGSCYPTFRPVLTPDPRGGDDEMSFYMGEGHWSGQPTTLMRFVFRQDGFVSRHAGIRPRTVVSRPVVCEGGRLFVNFATSARGHLNVTVKGPSGETLKSCELFGDKVDREVQLEGGSLAALKGRKVTVEFELLDGDLYSFRFR